MPKSRIKLRSSVFATDNKASPLSPTESTSKYFSSKTSDTEFNVPSNSPPKPAKRQIARKHIKHVIIQTEESSTDTANLSNALPSKKLIDKLEKSLDKEPPVNWDIVYAAIKEFRQSIVAPVDTMGCERLADEPSDIITPQTSRFQSLVALMLSSQTKDQVTAAAIQNLRQKLPGGLNLDSILQAEEEFLDECISKVGFHRKKAKYLKQSAKVCKEEYDNDIPDTVEGLMKLPGVGPKMAYLCMQVAWKQNQGIGVDVHVHRISNRLGWCKTEKVGPENTRQSLESWLPRSLWREINPILVGFGQTTCLPRYPKCSSCPVSNMCPSANF
ncbi:7047_t:CDS:2 [Funneliformis geosporum]|uniref:Endonuclease III homolog n=1 Tax=Funneliformis geosporum TaxID=1117311 RepID=A0A9W4WN06_9GLOM|nr:7047_t:CDS:2 [Funneliformis geosporum]CAI2166075.1 46_t:CDS:2 [Funneliformis geosporum]